jgi:phytoene dehydrogenase-like protein
VKDGVATGVVLASGEEIPAKAIVSNADPKRTFLTLVDPLALGPDFLGKVRNYRSVGTVAKVNLALSGAPRFGGLNGTLPPGRVHVGPEIDALERAFDAAKYGGFSTEPYLEAVLPTVLDPSLAPAGKHVMSVTMQFAPYKLAEGDWNSRREELGDAVVAQLARYAPGLEALVEARQVLTPLDLETRYGLTGGHPFHGEPSLDQLFTMRPILGWAQYRTPVRGLYLCGAGTHPGGGVTGAPGANAAREIARDLRR